MQFRGVDTQGCELRGHALQGRHDKKKKKRIGRIERWQTEFDSARILNGAKARHKKEVARTHQLAHARTVFVAARSPRSMSHMNLMDSSPFDAFPSAAADGPRPGGVGEENARIFEQIPDEENRAHVS